MTGLQREQVQERHDAAIRDLLELEDQVRALEVSADRAAILRERYESEAAAALTWLDDDGPDPEPTAGADRERVSTTDRAQSAPPPSRRRWVGLAGGLVVVLALGFSVTQDVQPRQEGGVITGGVPSAPERSSPNATLKEMAAVVEENPDVVPMRLALAHRYLDAGRTDQAADEYMAVLERTDDPEAMAHLGWLLFLDDQLDLAVPLLEESLKRRPDDVEAMWFMANVRLYGQERPQQALPLLERLLAREGLGDQRDEVRAAIDDAMAMQRRRDNGGGS